MIDEVISSLELKVISRITSGHRCKDIYRVLNPSGAHLVLKFSDDEEGKEEIRRNLEGYGKIKTMGLEWLIPDIASSFLDRSQGYILMQDCGNDFAAVIQDGHSDMIPYGLFEGQLLRIYSGSLGIGSASDIHLQSQVGVASNLYENFFQPQFSSPELNQKLKDVRSQLPSTIPSYCFSSWDFMPGNIFFSPAGLKFVDPTETVTGIPMIELACFAGALRDVHHHPFAEQWIVNLREFSIGTLATMLNISKRDAQQIWAFGELMQSLLSLRASIQQNWPNVATFAKRVENHLEKLFF